MIGHVSTFNISLKYNDGTKVKLVYWKIEAGGSIIRFTEGMELLGKKDQVKMEVRAFMPPSVFTAVEERFMSNHCSGMVFTFLGTVCSPYRKLTFSFLGKLHRSKRSVKP